MSPEEQERFNKANETVHPVETQWHHKILVPLGYVPLTPSCVGFVRSYLYQSIETGHQIECNTGVNADYWIDRSTGKQGYWADLEPHVLLRGIQ